MDSGRRAAVCPRLRGVKRKIVAVLATALLGLSGCATGAVYRGLGGSTSHPQPSPVGPSPTQTSDAPSGLQKFYDQEADWSECGKFECAEVEVPLNYEEPDAATIKIFMKRRPASGAKLGSLFLNPGGPGGSGADMLASLDAYLSQEIQDAYDVIGFDPRGVGKSSPVKCLDDAELGRLMDASYSGTPEEQQAAREKDLKILTDGCQKRSGEILPFVGTEQAARDMDVMRAVVGDPLLNYLGFSYGTFLGAQYRELFPENTGRMILDGAVDSSLGAARMSAEQSDGFEVELRRFVEYCQSRENCPLEGSVDDGLTQIRAWIDEAKENPFEGKGDRKVNDSILINGLITTMYDDTYWNYTISAFREMKDHRDANLFLTLSDLTNGRNSDGSFESNMFEANIAINCADYPAATQEEIDAAIDHTKGNTVLGTTFTESDTCKFWPASPDTVPGLFTGKGGAPVVVVGTKYDPATPLAWAESMADALDSAVLVTYEGDGHTAYSRGGKCVQEPLDNYLLTGEVPRDGLTCPKV